MGGKVTSIEGIVPEPKLRDVISYETSPLFTRGQAERYNPDDLVATKGLRIYRAMMLDEQVKAVMTFKRDAITSRGWAFSFDDEVALSEDEQTLRMHVLNLIVQRMRGSFEDALNSVARGRQFGFSMTEIVFDNITVGGKQFIGLNSLKPRDPGSFKFYTDPYGTLEKIVQQMNSEEIKIDPARFVHYVHAPEEDQFYGQSDLRQAYRAWYVKDQIIKLYATYLERFAGGFAALELQEGNAMVPGSTAHVQLQDILRNMRNMAGMILPPNVKLNVIQPGNTAEYREALTYFDLAIAKSLLVPNLLGLSHTGQTGSYSQSQTQLEAFFWTLNADTRRLEACLNEQLFKPLCDMNWGDAEYPAFSFKPASQDHVRWLVTTWKDLVGAKAVETTAEDEAYLRKLLEMPAREINPDDEDDNALASDASAAYDAGQITAMLDVLAKVGDMTIPKEVGVQVLVQSFPITEEQARAMVNPIVPKKPEPQPVVAKPNGAAGAQAREFSEHHFHTPGGHGHDQQHHGNWADDSPGRAWLRQQTAGRGGDELGSSDLSSLRWYADQLDHVHAAFKPGQWLSTEDMRRALMRGKRRGSLSLGAIQKTTARIQNDLREVGALRILWDKDGNSWHALVDTRPRDGLGTWDGDEFHRAEFSLWDESKHPRGKTSPDSTPGSFAPDDAPSEAVKVEVWHDKQSRNWIVQLFDADGNEIENQYFGDKATALDQLALWQHTHKLHPAPATMTGSAINAELDKLSKLSSDYTERMIAAGRGDEKFDETRTKTDWLSLLQIARLDRHWALDREVEQRAGPGWHRLPRGVGRKARMTWDESAHPRAKTTADSTPGSFAPKAATAKATDETAQDLWLRDNGISDDDEMRVENALAAATDQQARSLTELRAEDEDLAQGILEAKTVYIHDGYVQINNYLRGIGVEREDDSLEAAGRQTTVGDAIPALDELAAGPGRAGVGSLLDKLHRDDLTVYRGVWIHKDHDDEWFDQLRPGASFTDPAYTSTSIRSGQAAYQAIARRYDARRQQDRIALFRLRVTRDTKAFIGSFAEDEIVLGRGSTFRVTGITQTKDNIPVIDLDVEAQE